VGPYRIVSADQERSLSRAYDRLAGLLADHTPDRLAVFWKALPTMGRKKDLTPFDDAIKARVKALDLSSYRLAKMSGVSAVVIQRFLNGDRGITLNTAGKLCGAIGLVLVPETE
jgi:hypothetical protein